MFTKREIIEMHFSDMPGGIEDKFLNEMVKNMSTEVLIDEFNRKSKGSRVKISAYINGYIEMFELDFFEFTNEAIFKLAIHPKNIHYHNNKNMSRNEMRYRLLHGIDL